MGRCSSPTANSSVAAQMEVSPASLSAMRMSVCPLPTVPTQGVWKSQGSAVRSGFVRHMTDTSFKMQWQVNPKVSSSNYICANKVSACIYAYVHVHLGEGKTLEDAVTAEKVQPNGNGTSHVCPISFHVLCNLQKEFNEQ